MTYEVSMFEGHRMIVVRVKAPTASAAKRKVEALCPDAVFLTTKQVLRQGVRA